MYGMIVAQDRILIRGRLLRYLLVLILDRTRGVMTIAEIEQDVGAMGFRVAGPPGKAVSDSLRWALGHGHARRVARGLYVTGGITKQTRYRYRRRIHAYRQGQPADSR